MLSVRGIRELNAANAHAVRDALCAAVVPGLQVIEVDLSELNFVDGCGLGALAALYKTASERDADANPIVRLINPQPAVLQVIELTRMHHLFEVVARADELVVTYNDASPVTLAPTPAADLSPAPTIAEVDGAVIRAVS